MLGFVGDCAEISVILIGCLRSQTNPAMSCESTAWEGRPSHACRHLPSRTAQTLSGLPIHRRHLPAPA